jgi:integrase
MATRPRGSSWQADLTFTSGPNKGRHRPTFDTEAGAKAWELDARAANLRGQPLPSPNPPAHETGAVTAQSRKGNAQCLSDALRLAHQTFWRGTASDAKALINIGQIEAYFGREAAITTIDTAACRGFVAHCQGRGNADGTVNRKLAVLSKALRLAFDEKRISEMPKFHRKKEHGSRIRFLSGDEEKALLATLVGWGKGDHAEVVTCLIDTGFRLGELWRLIPRDIDMKAGTITVWKSKTDHPRTIYMTTRVRAILKRRVGAVTAPADRLFPYDHQWIRHTWERVRVHLGFASDKDFVPYVCRHTCASRMVQRGVPIVVVKEWMGHKTVSMTMRYAHLAPTNLRAAAEALEAAE